MLTEGFSVLDLAPSALAYQGKLARLELTNRRRATGGLRFVEGPWVSSDRRQKFRFGEVRKRHGRKKIQIKKEEQKEKAGRWTNGKAGGVIPESSHGTLVKTHARKNSN